MDLLLEEARRPQEVNLIMQVFFIVSDYIHLQREVCNLKIKVIGHFARTPQSQTTEDLLIEKKKS